jgi:hypothetical protein
LGSSFLIHEIPPLVPPPVFLGIYKLNFNK